MKTDITYGTASVSSYAGITMMVLVPVTPQTLCLIQVSTAAKWVSNSCLSIKLCWHHYDGAGFYDSSDFMSHSGFYCWQMGLKLLMCGF
jgi:hypothetical protein